MSWIVNDTYIHFDILMYMDIPTCPTLDSQIAQYLPQHLSTCIVTFLISLYCFVLALLTIVRYNSMTVLNRKVNSPSISNRIWALYFGLSGIRFFLTFIRYVLLFLEPELPTPILLLEIMILIVNGLAPATLSFALYHQFRYRTAQENSSTGKIPLIICYFALFYYAMMLLEFILPGVDYIASGFIFFSAIVIQKLFTAVIVVLIIYTATSVQRGPKKTSLIFLGLFVFTFCWYIVPIPVWTWFFCGGITLLEPYRCLLYVAALPDLLYLEIMIPYTFLLLFIRLEYFRNIDEARWNQVSKIQDMFDFEK